MMKQVNYPSRGKTIYGFAHVPKTNEPGPALILCHGFTGSACESCRQLVYLAEAASAKGIYVLRSDFLGSGNSDADFAEYTNLSGWAADILSAVHFLSKQPEVDPSRIGTMGISFGGGASLLAGADPKIKAVGGWAAVIHPEPTFRSILSDENWDALLHGAEQIDHIYAGSRFSLKPKFVTDILSLSITDAVLSYGDKPLLLMQGDLDDVIDPSHAEQLSKAATCPVEYHPVTDEDHSFARHLFENIDTTVNFFLRKL